MQSKIECPVCKEFGMRVTFDTYKIPHFGEAMISLSACSKCGYKHSDTLILEEKGPVGYTLKIDDEKDMFTKVIKSSYATIEIPELGVKITPGSHSEGCITNVEGVLARIEDVVKGVNASDKAALKKAGELLKKIALLKEGIGKATLHLLDPTGNSAIVSDKAVKEP